MRYTLARGARKRILPLDIHRLTCYIIGGREGQAMKETERVEEGMDGALTLFGLLPEPEVPEVEEEEG